jgi:hypothetical protein
VLRSRTWRRWGRGGGGAAPPASMELWDIYDAADDELLQELARLRQEGGCVHAAALALSPTRVKMLGSFRQAGKGCGSGRQADHGVVIQLH